MALTIGAGLLCSTCAQAWGTQGHRLIGQAAYGLLGTRAAAAVSEILGTTVKQAGPALDDACNWPDEHREEPGGEWTAPMHYVNIPRSARHYDRQRDCPDGLCVTESILRYAAELGKPGIEPERRWQALGFLCHFVGDLHQPLHAGFRDDRGGNNVTIEYRGQETNLHEFWDGVLANERLDDEAATVHLIVTQGRLGPPERWHPTRVVEWTDESHALALTSAYPPGKVIDKAFAERTWTITMAQWQRAAERLASVLNEVLGDAGNRPAH